MLWLRSVIFRGKSKSVIRKGNSSLAWEMLGSICSLVQNALNKWAVCSRNQVCRSRADLSMFPSKCNLGSMPQRCAQHLGSGEPRWEAVCAAGSALPPLRGSPLHALQPLQGEALWKAETRAFNQKELQQPQSLYLRKLPILLVVKHIWGEGSESKQHPALLAKYNCRPCFNKEVYFHFGAAEGWPELVAFN